MTVRAKLIAGTLILVSVTVYVAYLGASSSWQYYVTVDECVARASQLTGRQIRVSGRVASGSLQMTDQPSQATFGLTGAESRIKAICPKPLPDNLAEDMDVVVEGRLAGPNLLRGEKVLTRCASKYESQ
jgi:cytochrome c-type biogenesis protein CcmE